MTIIQDNLSTFGKSIWQHQSVTKRVQNTYNVFNNSFADQEMLSLSNDEFVVTVQVQLTLGNDELRHTSLKRDAKTF